MANLDLLKAELAAGHPDTGAYNTNDALAAAEINVVNRTLNRNIMSGSEVFNVINKAEFNALSAANKQLVWNILHLVDLNPFGLEAALLTDVFGGGSTSTTITDLAVMRKTDVSRATELGLGRIGPGLVTEARKP